MFGSDVAKAQGATVQGLETTVVDEFRVSGFVWCVVALDALRVEVAPGLYH